MSEFWANQAVREIKATYGDKVSLKGKSLNKFGRNEDIGISSETVWSYGGNETYPTTNAIDKVVSSNAGDEQTVVIEGHTIASGILTFVTQTATLNGQTAVTLTTPLARATRIYNTGTSNFAGTVYVHENDTLSSGVPQTASKVHVIAEGAQNQSLKCATLISNKDYWIITGMSFHVRRNTDAAADFELQIRQVGTTNKVFRSIEYITASRGGPFYMPARPYIIIPKNHDVRVTAIASTTAVSVAAQINGALAVVV